MILRPIGSLLFIGDQSQAVILHGFSVVPLSFSVLSDCLNLWLHDGTTVHPGRSEIRQNAAARDSDEVSLLNVIKTKVEFYKFSLVIVNLGIRQILAISLKPAVRQIVSRTFLDFAEEAVCVQNCRRTMAALSK